MSKQSDNALAAIDRVVFQSTKPIVVALTGGWGEGKTYFWKEVIAARHKDVKPGYVSVFGAESMAVIRERVALASLQIDLSSESKVADAIGKILGPIAKGLRAFANVWGAPFGISDSLAIELLQNVRLKPGWVLCIDDVERRSVELDTLLGYVSELRDKWRLKVVLIYNREPLEAEQNGDFRRYEEKVIDRSIPFALDFEQLVDLAFRDIQIPGVDIRLEVRKGCEILGLRNIRVLFRARSYFDEICLVVGSSVASEFLQVALRSLLLFTYTRFSNQKPIGLTFDLLASHSEWADRFRRKSSVAEEDDEKIKDPTKDLLERYGYMVSDNLDLCLMKFVETDVLDADKLRVLYAEYTNDVTKQNLNRALQSVWDRQYHGTLRDNASELCDAIEAALPPFLPYIPPSELDFAVSILDKYGRPEAAQRYFDEFKRIRGHIFEGLDPESSPMGSFEYEPLKRYLRRISETSQTDERTIGEVMRTAFDDRFVSSRDGDRLAQFSADDLANYFLSHDQPKLTSKIRALVQTGNDTLRKKVLDAVEKVAAKSPLNRTRMDGMGLLRRKQPAVPDE